MMAEIARATESSNELKARLSKALFELNLKLASCKSGALVQVWMPEVTADGSVVLSAQGLPFAIAGVGDLLALFRCVSCRYRFSTDVTRPALMGAIGRVYSSCEPEMSHNVQKYDKQVYLRVSEAQRCRVHSTLVMPVFGAANAGAGDRPVAVFELVQADRDVPFPAVIAELRKCLNEVSMSTSDPELVTTSGGLRNWPMHIDSPASLMRELLGEDVLRPASSVSNSAGRLLLENDAPDEDEVQTGQLTAAAAAAAAGGTAVGPGFGQLGAAVAAASGQARPASSFVSVWAQPSARPVTNGAAASKEGPVAAQQAHADGAGSSRAAAAATPAPVKAEPSATAAADASPGSGQGSAHVADEAAGAAAAHVGSAGAAAAAGGVSMAADDLVPGAATKEQGSGDSDEAQSKQHSMPSGLQLTNHHHQQQQSSQQQDSSDKNGSNGAVLTTQMLNALATAATNIKQQAQQVQAQPAQQQQQQQQVLDLSSLLVNSMQALLNQHSQTMQAMQQQQQQPQQQAAPQPQQQQQQQQQQQAVPGIPDPAALSSAISTLIAAANSQAAAAGNAGGAAASQPLLAAVQQLQTLQQQLGGGTDYTPAALQQLPTVTPGAQQQAPQQQQQMLQSQGVSLRRNASSTTSMALKSQQDEGEEEDDLLGSDEDDEFGAKRPGSMYHSSGGSHANRPMGAGRRLTFEDLQAQFGLGLKEAAANLGICATTLKRACRRNGITRWPRRQIQKLNRTLNQMGPQQAGAAQLGELVQSAIKKNLKPQALTPAVTASLQQHLLQQAGASGYAGDAATGMGRSASLAIPRPGSAAARQGSGSGSFTGGMNSLAGSLGEGGAGGMGALGMTCGSAGAAGQFLPGFGGFSFSAADGSGVGGLAGSLGCEGAQMQQLQQLQALQQQQAILQQQLADQQRAALLQGAPGSGSGVQAMLSNFLPQHDIHQQHLAIMQTQAMLNHNTHLQHLVAQQQQSQQQDDGLAAAFAMQQQQQLPGLPQAGSMQHLGMQQMQQLPGPGLMLSPGASGSLAGAAGMRLYNSSGSYSLPGSSMNLAAQQQQQLSPAAAGSPGTAPSGDTAGMPPASMALHSMGGQAMVMAMPAAPSAAAAAGAAGGSAGGEQQVQHQLLGDLEAPGPDGFFDLLSDDMLLDDGGLDLGLAGIEATPGAADASGPAR